MSGSVVSIDFRPKLPAGDERVMWCGDCNQGAMEVRHYRDSGLIEVICCACRNVMAGIYVDPINADGAA